MIKTVAWEVDVLFGDCDPAGIVFFPNFHKWMDASSTHFFRQCGVPPWRELLLTRGIVGTPVVENHVRFKRPATYGDRLQVSTSVIEWRSKVFIQKHTISRDGMLLCEGEETRAFVVHPPGEPERIQAIAIPEDIKAMCQ